MGYEPGHPFIAPAHRDGPAVDLPIELGFLRTFGIDAAPLRAAERAARWENVCPAHWLIANGHVDARTYYRALARRVGLPFVTDWPAIAADIDPAAACRIGCVRLAGAAPRWLLAPEGRNLRALLEVRPLDPAVAAISTPAHLVALVHGGAQDAIERLAVDALPDSAPHLSARTTAHAPVIAAVAALLLLVLATSGLVSRLAGDVFGLAFFAGIVFRLCVAGQSLSGPDAGPAPLSDSALPTYSVLVPLHDEAELVPQLLAALEAIDYPRAKLQVLVLLEPEDMATRCALAGARLPPWVHVVLGPFGGQLRTKPRALNIGLAMARGALITVYDAEDRPEPDQLRRAAAAFAVAPDTLACLQARLAIHPRETFITRLFALEYAALFDVLNIGTARLGLPMALGGTSNHFRTSVLRDAAGGWDAWNVTEDADLGLRLARLGYDVDTFAATTREAAPDRLGIWMKQRRRWTKGWMQTLLVLGRDAPHVARQLGPWRMAAMALTMVNLVLGPLLFPLFGMLVVRHLWAFGIPTPRDPLQLVEATLAACVLVLGTISTLWCGGLGMRARGLWRLWPCLPGLLPYQLLISAAAWMGLFDLLRRPHHWHKTPHRPSDDLSRSSP